MARTLIGGTKPKPKRMEDEVVYGPATPLQAERAALEARVSTELRDRSPDEPILAGLTWEIFETELLANAVAPMHRLILSHFVQGAKRNFSTLDPQSRMKEFIAICATALRPELAEAPRRCKLCGDIPAT